MIIICSYCRKNLGQKEPFQDQRMSHTMCPECLGYFMKQIKGLPIEKYLENFLFPVLIVNADGRIIASNLAAEKMTGKTSDEISGFLGGEVMECQYARLPEGCGNTVHCESCTIRRAIMSVMENGQSQDHKNVKLKQDDKEIKMIISVKKIDDVVQMIVEESTIS